MRRKMSGALSLHRPPGVRMVLQLQREEPFADRRRRPPSDPYVGPCMWVRIRATIVWDCEPCPQQYQ
jgi:hypothetical protein